MQSSFNFVLMPGLVGKCLCSDSTFHLQFPPGSYILHSAIMPSHVCPQTRAVGEATTAINISHSSTSAAHSGSSWNKVDTLSPKIFLPSSLNRVYHFVWQDLLVPRIRVSHVGFVGHNLQTTTVGGDQSAIMNPF